MANRVEITVETTSTRLTLEDLCRVSAVEPQWVIERIRAGLISAGQAIQTEPDAWNFDATSIERVRCMARLERDFDAVPELAALVADLQDEIARLRAQLRRAGF
jgi:chaperone modulatory protein CbpM